MKKTKHIAVYPGTFDPLTNGHLDIIRRSSVLFDEVFVAVSNHRKKKPFFNAEERCESVMQVAKEEGLNNVKAVVYNNMLVDCAAALDAQYIIRGLRVTSDFDYEFQMTQFIRDQGKDAEVVYLMASRNTLHISSSGLKEIASLGGDISAYVPASVEKMMRDKFYD